MRHSSVATILSLWSMDIELASRPSDYEGRPGERNQAFTRQNFVVQPGLAGPMPGTRPKSLFWITQTFPTLPQLLSFPNPVETSPIRYVLIAW